MKRLGPRVIDETIDIEKRKKLSLSWKLKNQFQKSRIVSLKMPDNLENHVTETFIRDKSELSKVMASLDNEISK